MMTPDKSKVHKNGLRTNDESFTALSFRFYSPNAATDFDVPT
jgi:hypothetical protein